MFQDRFGNTLNVGDKVVYLYLSNGKVMTHRGFVESFSTKRVNVSNAPKNPVKQDNILKYDWV